jgi:hypothetical protein
VDRIQKSFEFANEATRQLLTLSAAILALTITLARDVTGDPNVLAAAWVAFLVSIAGGIWTLFALMFELDPGEHHGDSPPTLAARSVRTPSYVQIGAFVLGTALLAFYGISAVS